MLVVPGPPAVDDETAAQLRSLVATGYLGPGSLACDDCWATYRELEAKGVEFIEKPEERFYGIDAAFRGSVRQPLAAHPTEADRVTGEGLRGLDRSVSANTTGRSCVLTQTLQAA